MELDGGGAAGSLLLLLKSIGNKVEKHFFTTVDRKISVRKEFINCVDYYNVYKTSHLYNDQAGGYTSIPKFEKIKSLNHFRLIEYINKNKIDILHVNSTVLCHVLEQVKKNTNVKIVTHVRELIPKYDNGIVKKYMIESISNYSDALICISDNEAIPFKNFKNLFIIPNPFDFSSLELLKSYKLREKSHLGKDSILIAMGGQFSKSRGHINFLEAAKILYKEHDYLKDYVYFIVLGAKFNPFWKRFVKKIVKRQDLGQEYLDFLKKNKLTKNVLTFTYLETNEYHSILKEVDIFVRPSLAGDPWGRDIIEAMALGLPVVATGTSNFYVKTEKTGYLVPSKSADDLSKFIYKLIDDKEKRISFGKEAISVIKDKCDLKLYSKKIMDVYNSIL